MASGDFLAKIKLALEGKEAVVSGLQQTQQAAQQLSKTKVTTTFDKEGLATGKQIEETFAKTAETTKKATPMMEQFGLAMKKALVVAPVWMILRGAIMAVTNTIQAQMKFLIDLETAMTRIKIVGKGTAAEYTNLQNALVGLAYAYGTTGSEAADAALIFAQQGRTVKETIELTRSAMLASKILGTDIKTAVDDMTAAIEGFQLGIGDATSIVDKWINVEKQFAVTSKDLADATKVAGASAHQLGITMSEFLGDVTAVVEVTRKSGSEAARGLSFIYARLLTSGKETIEQIAKIPFYLDATGKSTNVVGTQLRSVSSILEELAGKWENLTVQEKLQIATSLGSKRQMVVVNALMQNYTASLDARIAALVSAGAAEKAFALIQDTTAIKLQRVSAAWNVLTTSIGDTSGFKASLSLFDKMIINFAALINYEKAYGALYTREINKVQLGNETTLNQIKSIEELISVREKLSKAPQTAENIDRLKKVQDAIDAISIKEPRIRVSLETGDPAELKKVIEDRLKELEITKIRLNVSLEFEPKIAAAEEQIRDLQRQLVFTGGTEAVKVRGELAKKEKEVLSLYQDQVKSIDEQYKIQKGQQEARKIITEGIDEEESLSTELTESEKERLNIEKELIKIRYNGVDAAEAQVQKEIELTSQSNTLYDAHTKNLKLEELSNKLLDAKLQKRQKEIDTLADLTVKSAQADRNQRREIEQTMELLIMSPESLAAAYTNTTLNRKLILENLKSFSEEQRQALLPKIAEETGLQRFLPKGTTVPTTITSANITQQIKFGEINIRISPENLKDLINNSVEAMKHKMETDPEYKKIINNIIEEY
jgi:TP901 family phage tail tape measure protein